MMKTAAQILEERDQQRKAFRLAHTPNGSGEFSARLDCSCYTCRDVLDPTGEEDAKAYNERNAPPPPPPIDYRPASSRTFANTWLKGKVAPLECSFSTPISEILRSQQTHLNLPPPPPLEIRQASTATSLSIMSPLVGIATPRSASDASQTPEEKVDKQEQQLTKRLVEMVKSYQQLQQHIDSLSSKPGTKHDEIAMYDAWWEEVDRKLAATQELLTFIQR